MNDKYTKMFTYNCDCSYFFLHRATIPIYGKHILNFFDKSASSNYKKLSSRIDVVMTSEEGLQRAADGG